MRLSRRYTSLSFFHLRYLPIYPPPLREGNLDRGKMYETKLTKLLATRCYRIDS